jgi:hypothetical protein
MIIFFEVIGCYELKNQTSRVGSCLEGELGEISMSPVYYPKEACIGQLS